MHPAIFILGVSLALPLGEPLVVECTQAPYDLQSGVVGVEYAATVAVAGGTPPYGWQASGLPPGLTIAPDPDSSTATIAGVPTATGFYPVELTVVDAGGLATSAPCGVVVIAQPLHVNPAKTDRQLLDAFPGRV